MYSVTKNDKVSNWTRKIHAITPHVEFEQFKGKASVLVDRLSRLWCLGLHVDNDPEEPGKEYGKSIYDTDENVVNSIYSD